MDLKITSSSSYAEALRSQLLRYQNEATTVAIINSPCLRSGANLSFPPCWSVVNLFPSSVSDFSPHGYEVIGSVARPSSVEVPKMLTN